MRPCRTVRFLDWVCWRSRFRPRPRFVPLLLLCVWFLLRCLLRCFLRVRAAAGIAYFGRLVFDWAKTKFHFIPSPAVVGVVLHVVLTHPILNPVPLLLEPLIQVPLERRKPRLRLQYPVLLLLMLPFLLPLPLPLRLLLLALLLLHLLQVARDAVVVVCVTGVHAPSPIPVDRGAQILLDMAFPQLLVVRTLQQRRKHVWRVASLAILARRRHCMALPRSRGGCCRHRDSGVLTRLADLNSTCRGLVGGSAPRTHPIRPPTTPPT